MEELEDGQTDRVISIIPKKNTHTKKKKMFVGGIKKIIYARPRKISKSHLVLLKTTKNDE